MNELRPGFTFIEVIVATAIAGVVGGVIAVTLMRQQSFHVAAADVIAVRSELRDAGDVLVTDIRNAAVATYGLPLMVDSAIEMVTSIGASVVCSTTSLATLMLPPAQLASGNTLTAMLATPDDRDVALLYGNPSSTPDTARWLATPIVAFGSRSVATSCPSSTGFTGLADAAGRGYSVTLAAPTPAARAGTPIRFLRRVRYSLYRSSDSKWYLGYKRCSMSLPSTCDAVQPVSGPYDAYSPGSSSGLTFRYYDSTGAELARGAAGTSVARVDIVLRGGTTRSVGLTGDLRRRYRDSAIVTVAPRNRRR